ncbi:hypothetical protein RvY_13402 [Ramazzottius varieornatus]|uniref:Uncharacterized protein n=1 Tax=Ramazzottius varieornatus TaxID=947166 RepID=A0A1D1VPW9_RAMVA|nr:hypothetical protein RvY_13402 [Ramazzottius varieornatus]
MSQWKYIPKFNMTVTAKTTVNLPAIIFTKDKFEHQVVVITGLRIQGPTNNLENIPSKFMWFYNHDAPTTELKEWVAEQLPGPQ